MRSNDKTRMPLEKSGCLFLKHTLISWRYKKTNKQANKQTNKQTKKQNKTATPKIDAGIIILNVLSFALIQPS